MNRPIIPWDFIMRHEIASDEMRANAKGCFDMGEFVRKDDDTCLRAYCVIGVLPAHEKADVIAYIQSIDKDTESDDIDPDGLWWLAWNSCRNAQNEKIEQLISAGEHPMDAYRESWPVFRERLKLICDYLIKHTSPNWEAPCRK
jgi:hypothetical protein